MTTNKPLFVTGLAASDPASFSTARSRRKNDGESFANLMEVRGAMMPANQTLPTQSLPAQSIQNQVQNQMAQNLAQGPLRQSLNQAQGQQTQGLASAQSGPLLVSAQAANQQAATAETRAAVQNHVFNTLSGMLEESGPSGGLFNANGLRAMRKALANSGLTTGNAQSAQSGQSGQATLAAQVNQAVQVSQAGQISQAGRSGRVSTRQQVNLTATGEQAGVRGIPIADRRKGIPLDVPQRSAQSAEAAAGAGKAAAAARARRASTSTKAENDKELGKLAAQFESGSEGIAAIGYDYNGGTSYGKYQIASRPGSMAAFVSFLESEAPDLASRLKEAGPANTGSRKGEMPRAWREIAAEQPERFEDLQEDFIRASHYEPALSAVRQLGYNTSNFSPAMQEVLWSTAVQHGPAGAARIFREAAENVGVNRSRNQEKQIIREVYDLRAERFGSSSPQIQEAARRRMESEKRIALAMVGGQKTEAA